MNEERYKALFSLGCLPCRLIGAIVQCGKTEIHHQNLGGHAGQKRLGDDFTIPLGEYHHRGKITWNKTKAEMIEIYGPSLAYGSKPFHERFGSDAALLEKTNELLRTASQALRAR
jgi:hypothetical protein